MNDLHYFSKNIRFLSEEQSAIFISPTSTVKINVED